MSAPCPGCGASGFHREYMGDVGRRMTATGECFECAFWELRAAEGQAVVIDGVTYGIGPEPAPGAPRGLLGMGGRRFEIEFFDGRHVVTHNLWHGGEVPERFRGRIPNTARFANGARRETVDGITYWNPSRGA